MINKGLYKWLIIILFICFIIIPIMLKLIKFNEGFTDPLKGKGVNIPESEPIQQLNKNVKEIEDDTSDYNSLLKNNIDSLKSMQSSLHTNNMLISTNQSDVTKKINNMHTVLKNSNITNKGNTTAIHDMRREQKQYTADLTKHIKKLRYKINKINTTDMNKKLDDYIIKSIQLTSEILQKNEDNNIADAEFKNKIIKRLKLDKLKST